MTDATKDTVSISAASFGGTVTIAQNYAMYSSDRFFPAGIVSDNSLLSGGELTAVTDRVSTWSQLRIALEQGGPITVSQDITAYSFDRVLRIPAGVTAELDLQGHTLDASALQAPEGDLSSILTLDGGLSLSDTVGGGQFRGGGGFTSIIMAKSGSVFTMNGGTVTGSGSALEEVVFVAGNAGFTMNGGAITCDFDGDNSEYGRIYVDENGSFTMNGGTVGGSGGKSDIFIHSGRVLLNGGSLSGSNPGYGNVYVTKGSDGPIGLAYVSGSPAMTKGMYLDNGHTITISGPLGKDVIIPVMTETAPTAAEPVTVTHRLGWGGKNAIVHFTSASDTCAVGLNEDGEAFLGIPVTVTFAPGYETNEAMDPMKWAKDGRYPLPACGFSGPAGQTFAGWHVGTGTELKSVGELVSVTGNMTLTAVWQNLPFGTPDFEIPAAVTTIEDNAFDGIAATVVEIPESCTRIGNEAFKDCAHLTMIRIPAGCTLGTDVFDGCTKVYVFGAVGSDAQRYCNEHENCVFVVDAQD